MNKITFLIAISLITLSACDQNDFYDEVNPVTEIIETEGHDFYARGTIDGAPFSMEHISEEQYNAPLNDGEASSAHPFFGTNFTYDMEETPNQDMNLIFGITEIGSDGLLDVVRLGNPSWYYHTIPSSSQGDAVIQQLRWNDRSYITSINPESFQFNDFNITSIEQLSNDENLDDRYKNRLYKVEGNFQVLLYSVELQKDTIELMIDDFSGIFYDDSL